MVNLLYALAAIATVVVPWIIFLGAVAGMVAFAASSGLSLTYAAILHTTHDEDASPSAHVILAGVLGLAAVAVYLALPALRAYLAI